MNKVDILPRGDGPLASALGGSAAPVTPAAPSAPQKRRSSPRAVKLLLPVWGYDYVRQFLELGLPTLLAPGNVPALAQALPTEFIILTSLDDEPFIREHLAFKRLDAICPTEIRPIDHLISDGNYSTTITLAYAEAVRAVGEAMLDTCFFFLVSDYIMADGSLANALKRMQDGASAIVVGNFQIAREEALRWLRDKLRLAKQHSLALPPRELMLWALNHLHPATLANMVNIPFSHNSHTNRLFWHVDGNTILGRFFLMHMLCVRPELTNFVIGASCDYSFVPEMCPSGNVQAITDSDEYLVIEMQPRDHESAFLSPGPIKPRELAKSLSQWTTSVHRANANYSLLFHGSALPPQIASSIKEADAFISRVTRHLNRRSLPHRGHPYWHGAMAAFHDATGHRLSEEEWPYAFGLPPGPRRITHWLLWRAKHVLMGRPPYVLPWHPSWPDFRKVLQELQPFFADQNSKLLMVSNAPTAFSVALADSGDRVRRLRGMPFLQSFPERYEAMHGTFDFCLLELSEGDMQYGDDLIDRIAPLMKDGGSIIVFVANRRTLDTAREFGKGVTFHAPRFVRPGTMLTGIHFVPANRLRWKVHRWMLNMRTASNKRPWLAVPATALGGGAALCLSFIGNIDVMRRSIQVAPRGIASSLVMRLSIDAAKVASIYTYSRFQLERKKLARGLARARTADKSAIEQTREVQYNRCIELKNTIGLTSLGLMTNQVWYDDPRRLTFLLARYKFVAKMLSGRYDVGEVGCGDAFGTRVVLQEVPDVTVYDFDPVFIEDIRARQDERWPLKAEVHDIVEAPLPRQHEGLFSLDVLEHIAVEDEHAYLANLRGSLTPDGVLIIGTPSVESQNYASPLSKAGHVNCKSGQELKVLLDRYFTRVFLFSMNDEVVHTGFYPMAHYLFAICTGSK
jgi:SAM-dependent methyltransferase